MRPAPDIERTAELLGAAGIPLLDERRRRLVRAECMRVARRLKLTGQKVFGLVPTDGETAIPAVAIQLAISLTELDGTTVAYLDANTRWPAFGVSSSPPDEPFETLWLYESFAILSPTASTRKKDLVPAIVAELERARTSFQFVVVDLTGFDHLGELESALELVDQVLLVAASGKTREADLLEMKRRLPEDTSVLLVG